MIRICLTNREREVWLKLPSFPAEIGEACMGLDVLDTENPEVKIRKAEIPVNGLSEYFMDRSVTFHNLKELNFLARRLEGMTEGEQELFGVAVQIEKPYTLMEMVNLSCNLDKFTLYLDVLTEAQLGEYLIEKDYDQMPEEIAAVLDYEEFGQSYAKNHAGYFSQSGYVIRTGEMLEPLYDGKNLPDPSYEKNSQLKIACYKDHKTDTIYLPTPDLRQDYLKSRMGISSMEDFWQFSTLEGWRG